MRNDEFKQAVGKFPTGVTVISTVCDGKSWGFTANSFASVSLEPSLVSFCLNTGSTSFKAFNRSNSFVINILASDQANISTHFSQKGIDKFLNINHIPSDVFQIPTIMGSVCIIECKKYNQFECGDHTIFIGQAINAKIDQYKSPLLYFAKSYKEIS